MPPGVTAESQLSVYKLSKQATKPEDKSLCFTKARATKNQSCSEWPETHSVFGFRFPMNFAGGHKSNRIKRTDTIETE